MVRYVVNDKIFLDVFLIFVRNVVYVMYVLCSVSVCKPNKNVYRALFILPIY